MSTVKQNEIQMLNEYISALERQIKSNQTERQNLLQQVARWQQSSSKYQIQLRQLKNQLKQLSSVMTRQGIEKSNLQTRMKILSQQNDKFRKQGELKQQRIAQLTMTIKDKNQQIAKQKNSLLMTANYHSKQVTSMDDKIKQLQLTLNQLTEQRNLLNYSLQSMTEQLNGQKQQNQRIKSKNNFCQSYIQTLQGKLKIEEKQNTELREQNILLGKNLAKTNQELVKQKQDIEQLQLKLIQGSQSNEESKVSYEQFIKSLKNQHNEETALMNGDINRLKLQVQQLKREIDAKHNTIESVTNALTLQRSNLEKSLQKNADVSYQLQSLANQLERVKKQLYEEILSKQQIILNLQKQSQNWMTKWKRTQDQLEITLAIKYTKQEQYKFNFHQAQIKYHQQLSQKEDKIDIMTNKLNTQALQLEQVKYHFGESKKRQQRLIQQLKKKQSDIQTLQINLQMKREKIEELSQQMAQTYQLLQTTTKDYHQKGRQGEQLTQKQFQLITQIDNLKKEVVLLTKLKQQKNLQNKRLKTKIQALSEQLSLSKRSQGKLSLQVKQNQTQLAKTLEQFTNTKQGSQKKLAQTLKRVTQLQKQLQRLKKDYKQKQQLLKMLTLQYEMKTKQFSNKQQQLGKKVFVEQGKTNKLVMKISELEREMEKRESDFNKALQKLIQQHSLQQQETSHKHEQQIKDIQNKYFQQANNLTFQLQQKQQQLTQLQNELTKSQFTSVQFTSNQSSMQKTIIMLQKQLEQAHQQLNTYHQKLFSFNLNNDKTKELLLEKDIKIISLTALLEKAKKDNERLLHEEILLREQVAALETSTTYLKRQLTSTLQRQQVSMKEIKSLQQANKSYSKLISSTSSTNALNQSGPLTSRRMEKHKTLFNVTGEIRRTGTFEVMPQLQESAVIEQVVVEYMTEKKRENRVLHKQTMPQSSTSIDSSSIKVLKQGQISFSNMPIQLSKFTSSMKNSRSSGGNSSR